MEFSSKEPVQLFWNDKELTKRRREAGAAIESVIMRPNSEKYFTNFQAPI